ncbi:MAG: energy transducer TonB [Candidatus Korobacteraceae bacterium]
MPSRNLLDSDQLAAYYAAMVVRFHLLAGLIALCACGMLAQDVTTQIKLPVGTAEGLLIYKVQPIYPGLARQARVQGVVVLDALIGKDGTIQELTVESGHPMLIQAAMDAVKQWRYKPYLVDGEPVLVETKINVNFQLSNSTAEQKSGAAAAGSSSPPPPATQAGQPPPNDSLSGVYRVGNGVTPPQPFYEPDPEYSDQARKARLQGTVVLWLIVDADGLPQHIRVQRSVGMGLDEEAIKAVKQWRFKPSMKNGEPVPVMINVEVNFRLFALVPHPESAGQPPRFPGVDTSSYPLVVRLTHTQIRTARDILVDGYEAVLVNGGQQTEVTITCENTSPLCQLFDEGTYPARWIENGKKLEILGWNAENKKWTKTEYSVAAGQP